MQHFVIYMKLSCKIIQLIYINYAYYQNMLTCKVFLDGQTMADIKIRIIFNFKIVILHFNTN